MTTITLTPEQEHAVELVCTAPVSVVTGGAGTGKSTCMRQALERLAEAGATVALCAPTGKAAKRLAETTGRPASTIHRLLGYRPNGAGGEFARGPTNPLEEDLILVDEASMIDVELAASLMAAIRPDGGRVAFVGDANQLPSVGPGRVLADLVASERVPVARLTVLQRAAAESWVARNAPLVLEGQMPDLAECEGFRFVEAEDAADVAAKVEALAGDYDGAPVLIPQKTGRAGCATLNRALQARLNPSGAKAWDGLRIGDRVIQTRNDYQLEVFNGEVGTVAEVSKSTMTVLVEDVGGARAVEYDAARASALELAYALTVHKVQGSEWPWVIVVCHSTHTHMLSRQLLYTALTRAKVGVVLVGDKKGIRAALKDTSPALRNTELRTLIRAGEETRIK